MILKPEEILQQIADAGSWLPITVARRAFTEHQAIGPALLEAAINRAATPQERDIPKARLAAFGVFFLAQNRERRLFEPLVRLFETMDQEVEDEWLFSGRLFFFGHRLLAGVCPQDPKRPLELALDPNLKPLTRAIAVCTIGLQGVYGDVPRAEAINVLRSTFKPVRQLRNEWTDTCWVRTAAKLHVKEFERELQWFLASGRLDLDCRRDIARAMQVHPDAHLVSALALEPMVDLFSNVFPQEIRNGEIGLLPNGQIPGLELFQSQEPRPGEN